MIGYITYMSDVSMEEKFGRQRKEDIKPLTFTPNCEVEGYLQYHGENFVKRFDANSCLFITTALDDVDASGGRPLHEVLRETEVKVPVLAFI